jgi:predicted Rossmann-fold nucleotide-binding protein
MLEPGEWEGMVSWLRDRAVSDHRIEAADLAGLHLTSDPDEVVSLVRAASERQREHARRLRAGSNIR